MNFGQMYKELCLLEVGRTESNVSGTLENKLSCNKNWEKLVEN